MDENKIKIRFEYTNEYGDNFISETSRCRYDDESELDIFGECLDAFLGQCGYIRKNNMIFMESINEEEYDALEQYLCEFRNKQSEESNA